MSFVHYSLANVIPYIPPNWSYLQLFHMIGNLECLSYIRVPKSIVTVKFPRYVPAPGDWPIFPILSDRTNTCMIVSDSNNMEDYASSSPP